MHDPKAEPRDWAVIVCNQTGALRMERNPEHSHYEGFVLEGVMAEGLTESEASAIVWSRA